MIIPNFDFITTLLNIKTDQVEKLEAVSTEEKVSYYVSLKSDRKECPYCGGALISNGYGREKPIKHPTLAGHKSTIFFKPHRYLCRTCGKTITQDNPFTFRKFTNSFSLLRNVMEKLSNLNYTLKMIAEELNISSTQVNNYLDSYVTIPAMSLPECLGIDEIHSPEMSYKGSAYICVLVDNQNRCIAEVLGSRSKAYLDNFFYGYRKEEKDKVKYVTIDMWEPYRDLAYKHFRNCAVAVDPFHVIEHLCYDFSRIRINLMNQMVYGSNAYYLLKSWHKLLESDKYDLNNEPRYNHVLKMKANYNDIYKMLLEIDEGLTTAYELKEAYRDFNRRCTYEEAERKLDELIALFQKENIKEYEEFINIMISWKKEIVNSFILSEVTGQRLSNAKSESMNEQIGLNISISKGLANFLRFRKRMLYCFNDRLFYALTSKLTSMKRSLKQKKEEEKKKKL